MNNNVSRAVSTNWLFAALLFMGALALIPQQAVAFDITIQAENYSNMSGVQTEATSDTGGGSNVGWIDTGDWMSYANINIPTTGSYIVEYRVASANGGGTLSLDLNGGQTVLGQLAVPNTGGWQNWTTISHTVSINAGTYSFGVYAAASGWNINWFRIRDANSAPAAGSPITLDRGIYVTEGEIVAAYTTTRPSSTNWIGIYQDPGNAPVNGEYVGGSSAWRYAAGEAGSVRIPLTGLASGNYVAYYLYDDGYESLSSPVKFRISASRLSLDRTTYAPGTDVVATYSTDSSSSTNWVGIYPDPGAGPHDDANHGSTSAIWKYAPGGSGTVRLSTSGLAPGAYLAYDLHNDGYFRLQEPVRFRVVSTTGAAPSFLTPAFRLRNAQVGELYSASVRAVAVDPDGSALSYSLVQGSSWVTLSSDGQISGRPSVDGTVQLRIRATDAEGLAAEGTATIVVRRRDVPLVDQLKVVTLNVWHGATSVNDGWNKNTRFLLESGADLVGVQESRGVSARNLAHQLGWYYYEPSGSSVISKYPITATYDQLGSLASGTRVQVGGTQPREIVLWSIHLTAYPYGPYAACHEQKTVQQVIQVEHDAGRVGQINSALDAMGDQIAQAKAGGAPFFLVGDFNAPSHLDWVASTANAHCGYVIPWPTSVAVADAGLRDTYREANPDPATHPGNTWSPVYVYNDPPQNTILEPQDRIDFVHAAGHVTTLSSTVYVIGTPALFPNHADNMWASDHAAVVTTVRLD